MQAQQVLHALVAGQEHVAGAPQLVPRPAVALQRLGEVGIAPDGLAGVRQRLVDRAVARGVQRDELLDADGLALAHVEAEHLLDVVLRLKQLAPDVELLGVSEHARAGGLGDVDVRLARLDVQRDDLGAERTRRDGVEVAALEVAVARDAAVGDAAVERGDDLDAARPVLRRQPPLDRGLVGVRHAHEAPAAQGRLAPAAVAEAQRPADHGDADVVLVAVLEQLDVADADRVLALDAQLQHEPVGKVDEVLVEDRPAAHDRRLAVVEPVGVRARVVDVVGVLPLRRSAACRSSRCRSRSAPRAVPRRQDRTRRTSARARPRGVTLAQDHPAPGADVVKPPETAPRRPRRGLRSHRSRLERNVVVGGLAVAARRCRPSGSRRCSRARRSAA